MSFPVYPFGFLGSGLRTNFVISEDVENWVLLDEMGGVPLSAVVVTIEVESGVRVYGGAGTPGMDLTGLPDGSTVNLTNAGYISGKGGNGGTGGISGADGVSCSAADANPGQAGTNAIELDSDIILNIDNTGAYILGGGGGGGGGGSAAREAEGSEGWGGGGGGGAGSGLGGNGPGNADSGTAGSDTPTDVTGANGTGGAGGESLAGTTDTGGDGGDGGDWGTAGQNGDVSPTSGTNDCTGAVGTGGAAGKAIEYNGASPTVDISAGGSSPNLQGATS